MHNAEVAIIAAVAKEIIFDSQTQVLCASASAKRSFDDTEIQIAAVGCTIPYFLKQKKQRMEGFYEKWLILYENYDFFMHFQMCKETFDFFLEEVQLYLRENSLEQLADYHYISVEKGLLLTLWWLGKGETLASCAYRFNVGISTAHGITTKYVNIVVNIRKKFIRWPTEGESQLISQQFHELSGYPNVIGAIDGTHFGCVVPKQQHDSYANRKIQHSIIMQGICDSKKFLRDIFVGFPGSCNDGRVLQESPIYTQALQEPRNYFYNKYHLVGDKAYTCFEWLMTPYKDTGRLTRQQKKHNYLLSKARLLIENVFGLLKGRWRILQFINVYSIEKVIQIVVACAVLHNICLMKNDFFEAEIISDDSTTDDISCEQECRRGIFKRNTICDSL